MKHQAKTTYALTILFALWADAAQANGEVNYDDYDAKLKQIGTCIENATTREAMRACIGITFDACMEKLLGSRLDESACINSELDLLTVIYRREVMTHLDGIRQMVDSPAAPIVTRQTFFGDALEAEAKWNGYRESHCTMEMGWYGSGNAVGTANPKCHALLYVDRIFQLRNPVIGSGASKLK